MDIKRNFRDEWPAVAPAWERWHSQVRDQSAVATEWLLELACVAAGAAVLDLASGVGDPALDLARRVGSHGSVVATDLLSGPLRFVERAAREQGLTALSVAQCDMESLPFADSSFDAVTCRLGLMFATDLPAALAEVRRVLRPGARAAFVVWGTRHQPLFEHTLGALSEASSAEADELAATIEDAPGPFRFERPGCLSAALERAGFRDISEETRRVRWPFPGSAEEYWQMFSALAGPRLSAGLAALETTARAELVLRVLRGLAEHQSPAGIDPGAVLIGARGAR